MPYIAQSIDKIFVNPEPEEIHSSWEDVVDNYGQPEVLIPKTVWVVKAERDKEWHGHLAGDPVLLITRVRKQAFESKTMKDKD